MNTLNSIIEKRGRKVRRRILLFCIGVAILAHIPLTADPLALDPVGDSIVLPSGVVLGAVSLFFPFSMDHETVDIASVNVIDRAAMFPYSKALDTASTLVEYATFAAPLLLGIFLTFDQDITAGVIYGEVFSLAMFAKSGMKSLLPRVRPWVYLAPQSGTAPDVWEGNDSFPSGHATMAFAAASFGITYAAIMFPTAPWLVPFIVAEASGAVVTASLRVFAGMHFISDVTVGALLGTAFGVALPLLHQTAVGGAGPKSAAPMRFEVKLVSIKL
jgi:membrane-associated phospholipid phosphatase